MRSGSSPQRFSDGLVFTAQAKSFGFHFKISFSVDVGGVDRDVAEPGADGIHVDTCTKKMRRGRVANGVRADSFLVHVRHPAHGGVRMSRHDLMDVEASERLRATIEEHAPLAIPPGNEILQRHGCGCPERADTNLALCREDTPKTSYRPRRCAG